MNPSAIRDVCSCVSFDGRCHSSTSWSEPSQVHSARWRAAWVAATRTHPDDDAVADLSGQWRGNCRQSTPDQISLDVGTLREKWNLMHKNYA